MRILYLSNWSVNDALFKSSALPTIEVLSNYDFVQKITIITFETEKTKNIFSKSTKIGHHPILYRSYLSSSSIYLIKTLIGNLKLLLMSTLSNYDIVIARGATSLNYLLLYHFGKTGLIIESMEPHSLYMKDSQVWREDGIKYRIQSYIENHFKSKAKGLLPVTKSYKNKLIDEGISSKKIRVLPCTVDIERFKFDEKIRKQTRHKLNLGNEIVGIYVGKFGDIYLKNEAFDIIQIANEYFNGNFSTIVLSPMNQMEIQKLVPSSINVIIKKVSHKDVNQYMSAADFAFSFVKPGESKIYCSPIKNGEYWANGLPILQHSNIGDDSDIIMKEEGGAIFQTLDKQSILSSLSTIKSILNKSDHRTKINAIAKRHRDRVMIKESYDYFL